MRTTDVRGRKPSMQRRVTPAAAVVIGIVAMKDRHLDGEATSFACVALISAVLIGSVLEVARDGDGAPYSVLAAVPVPLHRGTTAAGRVGSPLRV